MVEAVYNGINCQLSTSPENKFIKSIVRKLRDVHDEMLRI